MGLLDYGTGVQSFVDSFLKTYMAIDENRRANDASKIAQDMAKQKLAEIQAEQKMRAEMAAYNQGLMNPVQGELQQPVPQSMPSFGMMGGAQLNVDPNLLNQPTRQTYANQYEAWRAQGKDPEREAMMGQSRILAGYDPAKSLAIQSQLYGTDERIQAQREIAAAKNQATMDALREKVRAEVEALKMKNDYASQMQAKELELKWAKLEAGKSKGSTTQTTLKFQNDYSKASSKRDELTAQMDEISTHADRLLDTNLGGITGIRGAIPNVPGSKSSDAQASLNSFKSKLGLTTLAALKSGSGAGLGQVTEAEHKLLQNFVSELENAQSEKALRDSIKRIKEWASSAKGRIVNAYDRSIYGQYDRQQNGEQDIAATNNNPSKPRFTIKQVR